MNIWPTDMIIVVIVLLLVAWAAELAVNSLKK